MPDAELVGPTIDPDAVELVGVDTSEPTQMRIGNQRAVKGTRTSFPFKGMAIDCLVRVVISIVQVPTMVVSELEDAIVGTANG